MTHTKRVSQVAVSLLIIYAVATLCYLKTVDYPFHFDDYAFFADQTFPYEKTAPVRFIDNLEELWSFNAVRFITFASFYLDYLIGGTNPHGYHVTNMTIHSINSAIVYWFATLLLGANARLNRGREHDNDHGPDGGIWIPLAAALIFATHPIQTQAVTYVWQRSSCLVFTFYILSLCLYLKSSSMPDSAKDRKRVAGRVLFAGSLVSGSMAMLTKQTAITLPLAVALVDIYFISGSFKGFIANRGRAAWFLVPFLVIPALTLTGMNREIVDIGARADSILSHKEYLLTEFNVIATYLKLLVYPVNQTLDYDFDVARGIADAFFSFMLLISLAAWGGWLYGKSRIASFGILFFFLALSVESSFFPLEDVIFEHRVYLPSMGFFISFVVLAFRGGANRGIDPKVTFAMLTLLVIIPLSIATLKRNETWADRKTLWTDVVTKAPQKPRGYNHLGIISAELGNFQEAGEWFEKAIRVAPEVKGSRYFLGVLFEKEGDPGSAIKMYEEEISSNIFHIDSYIALTKLYTGKKMFDSAYRYMAGALKINPGSIKARLALADIFVAQGRHEDAAKEYRRILAIRPNHPETLSRLGAYGKDLDHTENTKNGDTRADEKYLVPR